MKLYKMCSEMWLSPSLSLDRWEGWSLSLPRSRHMRRLSLRRLIVVDRPTPKIILRLLYSRLLKIQMISQYASSVRRIPGSVAAAKDRGKSPTEQKVRRDD